VDRDLDQLIGGLLSDDAYATGRRRYPRTVTLDDAVTLAGLAQAEVDRGAEAREVSARRDGMVMACSRGCNACCEELVLVFIPEAERIARWLSQPENAAAREGFATRYRAWCAAVGDAGERLADLLAKNDEDGYKVAHIDQWRRRVMCAFNADGECTIYPVRPVACRNAHAIETPARCIADSPLKQSAIRLAFKPLDDFLARARRLERAAHHAVGGARGRPEALCHAVAKRLGIDHP
jgi:Fe-S-cluster containining protein